MTTRILGLIINIVTFFLFITPLMNLAFVALQARILNMTLVDFLTNSSWALLYLLATLCIPIAAIFMQVKWRKARIFKRHAKDYFCLSLFLIIVSLILMGEYYMVIPMLFLFFASKYPLSIKYTEAFGRLRETASIRNLAGEWLILFVAIAVRIYIFTSLVSP